MIQPQFEILPAQDGPEAEFVRLEMGRIVPVYEFLGGTTAWGAKLTSRWLRRVVWGIFEELGGDRRGAVPETLPAALLRAAGAAGKDGGAAVDPLSRGGNADDGADVGGDAGASAADL